MEGSVKRVKYGIKLLLLILPAVLVILPVAVLLSGAITDSYEMMEDLGSLIRKTQEFISWRFIPEYPSFTNYVRLLFRSPEFYVLFWNSVFMVGRIDGAGEWALFWKLGLPIGKGGLLSAMVLGFLEYWNLMEQPMAFLKDASLWPLSLYLPQITLSQAGFAFCASVMMLIPAVFVFALGQDHLEQGIIYSGLKG